MTLWSGTWEHQELGLKKWKMLASLCSHVRRIILSKRLEKVMILSWLLMVSCFSFVRLYSYRLFLVPPCSISLVITKEEKEGCQSKLFPLYKTYSILWPEPAFPFGQQQKRTRFTSLKSLNLNQKVWKEPLRATEILLCGRTLNVFFF